MILERFLNDIKFSDKDATLLKHAALSMWQSTGRCVEECWFRASVDMLISKGVIKHLSEAEMELDSSKKLKYKTGTDEENKQYRFKGV